MVHATKQSGFSKKENQQNPGSVTAPKNNHATPAAVPERYVIREHDEHKALSCIEAPNIFVQIRFGLSIPAASVNKAPPGTIYLDGVAQQGPMLDNARQVYNFDHHEGCVRPFTLATCEQVLIMIRRGFDLRSREWRIIANDPDLDTVLAIWLLLNHIRLSEQTSIREHILIPLIRLEGAIDALGLELKTITGLPAPLIKQSQRIIDYLRRKENRLKKEGQWGEQTDFLAYTAAMLHDIDQIMYEPEKFGELLGIEELARVNLSGNRVAVAVQSDMGIYEIEPLVKKIYGNSIGLVILRRTPTDYTLRQMDPFLPGSLDSVYERLNFMDPAVKCRPAESWGGSSDIGGSPRDGGTLLTPDEIVNGCQEAFQKDSFVKRVAQFFFVAVSAGAILSAATFFATRLHPEKWVHIPGLDTLVSNPYLQFSLWSVFLTGILLAFVSRGRLWQFGGISPMGKSWWYHLPVLTAGAFAGGAWAPLPPLVAWPHGIAGIPGVLVNSALLAFAAEFFFRGVLHGMLARKSRILTCRSQFFISWPNVASAGLYAASLVILPFFRTAPLNLFSGSISHGTGLFAAFAFGIFLGFARERSHSFIPPFLLHLIAILSIIFLPALFSAATHYMHHWWPAVGF